MALKKLFFLCTIALAFTASAMRGPRDYMYVDDALRRAKQEGVSGQYLADLEKNLKTNEVGRDEGGILVDRATAQDLISEAGVAQVMGQSAASTPPAPKERRAAQAPATPEARAVGLDIRNLVDTSTGEYKDFVTTQRELEGIRQRRNAAQSSYEKTKSIGDEERVYALADELNGREHDYIEKLRVRKHYFYGGDALWYYLGARGLLQLMRNDPVYGPIYALLDNGAPFSTLNLKNPFVYLISFNQIENICGFGVVANAYASHQLAQEGRPLACERTRALAEMIFTRDLEKRLQKAACGEVEYAWVEQLLPVMQEIGLNPTDVELLSDVTIDNLSKALNAGKPLQATTDLIAKLGKMKDNSVQFIVYNIAGVHWVILPIVKIKGIYTMYLLNSTNAPLEKNDPAVRLVRYIDAVIERVKKK